MERTVPTTASEEIELYLRTVYSLLRSTTEIQIRTLEEVHSGMNSLLHPDARRQQPDMSAFIYSILRLPACINRVRSIILGQSSDTFIKRGFGNIETWEPVSAVARRRRCFYNGQDLLVCYIASRTDIEDLVPTLTAYQIEWNKIHLLLRNAPRSFTLAQALDSKAAYQQLAEILQISLDDLDRLQTVWGADMLANLETIQSRKCNFRLLLLGSSMTDYWRATRMWWDNIERACPDLLSRPVYFVSSNTHSIVNLLTGFALKQQEILQQFLEQGANRELYEIWKSIREGDTPASMENFLYYVLKEYEKTAEGARLTAEQDAHERANGIVRVPSEHSFDVEAQVIDLSRLDFAQFDPRLGNGQGGSPGAEPAYLQKSDALILNIDYPLGLAAFNILAKIAEHANPILGVYFIGKAASLNAVRGDVMIPNVVQDEHSQNTYLFQNAFTAGDVAPYLVFGTVLDNQKAVSVFGTFLQNARIMDVFYREGYTDIEMESGPYLSAVYEMTRPKRHPVNEIVNLYGAPFDIGILHYASDTPLSKGKNLGAGSMSYFGLDSTYASSVAVLRRILSLEKTRLK